MALTTVKSIERALTQIDTKKQNLKQAFDELQSRSSLLSQFHLNWADLDSHFTSLQSHLQAQFSALQALHPAQTRRPRPQRRKDPVLGQRVPARPELKALCASMDGLGLRKYVIDRPKDRTAIRVELADAYGSAPDAGSLVLDALEGFWSPNQGSGSKLRRACVALLEELMRAEVEIGAAARERAVAVAAEWRVRVSEVGDGGGEVEEDGKGGEEEGFLERLGYLQLLATYKVVSDGGDCGDELIDCVVSSAKYRQAVDLCRILGVGSKISDVIQRLIIKGKQLLALKFIFEFELTEEFPPVPLLKAYLMNSKKIVQKVRKTGKNSRQSLNEAAMKEISALKSVVRCIESNGLESQYPKDELVTRIEILEKEKDDRKKTTPAPAPKPPVKQPTQNGTKRMRVSDAGRPAFKRKNPNNPAGQSVNRAGLYSTHAAPYHSFPAGAYGTAGTLVAAAPYVGPSSGVYGLAGGPQGFSGNPNPSEPNNYPSEIHAQQPGYYDRTMYVGYDVPSQYHQVYYPQ